MSIPMMAKVLVTRHLAVETGYTDYPVIHPPRGKSPTRLGEHGQSGGYPEILGVQARGDDQRDPASGLLVIRKMSLDQS